MGLNVTMTTADKLMLVKFHRVIGNAAAAPAEQEKALVESKAILKKYGLKYGDLEAAVAESLAAERVADEERRRRQSAAKAPKTPKKGAKVDALSLVHGLLQRYIDMQPHEYVGVALWTLHTHVYDRFLHTPRLSLMSPTRECGKTNTIKVLKLLSRDAEAVSSISAAALFRAVDQGGTVIIDEADNANLFGDFETRKIINSGFDKTSATVKRHKETFGTFAPMAFAGIGRLPLPLLSRSLCIHLERSLKNYSVLNPDDEVMRRPFDVAAAQILDWAEDVKLNPLPEMSFEVRARDADKWRVLISIADSFGAEWGKRARDAAIAFGLQYAEQEVQTMLLLDCEKVFNQRHVDRIRSEDLLSGVLELDTQYPWTEYRGPKDDENVSPRTLRHGDMTRLLGLFRDLRTKKIRFNPGGPLMGYERQQFELHWARYNPKKPGTPELKLIQGGSKK